MRRSSRADETFVGKARNAKKGKPIPKKYPVVALIERGGQLRARHVAEVTAKNVRKVLVTQASRKSMLMTDDAVIYERIGKEFDAQEGKSPQPPERPARSEPRQTHAGSLPSRRRS